MCVFPSAVARLIKGGGFLRRQNPTTLASEEASYKSARDKINVTRTAAIHRPLEFSRPGE
jgi:hypothetical protein